MSLDARTLIRADCDLGPILSAFDSDMSKEKRDDSAVEKLHDLIDQLLSAHSFCANNCPYVDRALLFRELNVWQKIKATFVIVKDLWGRR